MMRLIAFVMLMMSLLMTSVSSVAGSMSAELKQLQYREVFYHYYNKDIFSAITLLQARQVQGVLKKDDDSLTLLLGSMYGSYRLYDQADGLLSSLAVRGGKPSQRNLAWFYMGKTYLDRDQFSFADKAFSNIDKLPKPELQDELMYQRLNIRLDGNQLLQSDQFFDGISKHSLWKKYAQFNLGAAQIKAGNAQEGIKLISRIGSENMEDEELLSLRDKANVVLGYLFLREGEFEKARRYFERVRFDSPFSQKAMLGLGWAYSKENNYRLAMVPWKQLSTQGIHDLAVQEATLAMGFAYSQLNADAQALLQYEKAVAAYEGLQQKLNNTVFEVKNGRVTSVLLADNRFDDLSITRRLREVIAEDEGHLLLEMLKDKEFQKAFSAYRELKYLEVKQESWRRELQMQEQQGSQSKMQDPRLNTHNLRNRINNMDLRLSALLSNYELRLQKKMLERLDKQQRYVAHYLSQARFAIAQLLDDESRGRQ